MEDELERMLKLVKIMQEIIKWMDEENIKMKYLLTKEREANENEISKT